MRCDSCEREDKWLDEADYAIDTSIIPRGGGRRRKSMEPRLLANLNGNLSAASSIEGVAATPAKKDISPTAEFMTFETPASRRETFIIERPATEEQGDAATTTEESTVPGLQMPATPVVTLNEDADAAFGGVDADSPTTPYYLSKGAQLVQQTCPPKQLQKGQGAFFPVSGNIDEHPDENVRRRLMEARRKSLQWISKTRSPLGRTVS